MRALQILFVLFGLARPLIYLVDRIVPLSTAWLGLTLLPISPLPTVFDRSNYFAQDRIVLEFADGGRREMRPEEGEYGLQGPWHRSSGLLHILRNGEWTAAWRPFMDHFFCQEAFFASPLPSPIRHVSIELRYPLGGGEVKEATCPR